MNVVEWRTQVQHDRYISPGGFQWEAYVCGYYIGLVCNDGWSSVDCVPVNHGSIHLAALRVQGAAEAHAKKESAP